MPSAQFIGDNRAERTIDDHWIHKSRPRAWNGLRVRPGRCAAGATCAGPPGEYIGPVRVRPDKRRYIQRYIRPDRRRYIQRAARVSMHERGHS